MLPRALIFDFDGTILDTETVEFTAWQTLYAQHGQVLDINYWLPMVGSYEVPFNPDQHLQTLVGHKLDMRMLHAAVNATRQELFSTLTPREGVLQWLDDAKHLNIKLAVASSADDAWVLGHLERLQLLHYFEAVRTRDWVTATKPDPELYLLTSRVLQVLPAECVAIEDSVAGVTAALRAGMRVAATPNSVTQYMNLSAATWQTNLSEVSLLELLS